MGTINIKNGEVDTYKIWVNKKCIGTLDRDIRDPANPNYTFQYTPNANEFDMVSLSMPVRDRPYKTRNKLPLAFLQNIPSDSFKNNLKKWKNRRDDTALSDWDILGMIGQNQIGRVSVTPTDVTKVEENPPSELKVSDVINATCSQDVFDNLMQDAFLSDAVNGGLPKVARSMVDDLTAKDDDILTTSERTIIPDDFIIKNFPTGSRYPFLCANEYLCSLTAMSAGIPTVNIRLSSDYSLNVIKRFDRILQDGKPYRYGFDDGLTLLQYIIEEESMSAQYNSSYEQMATEMLKHIRQEDKINLFKRVAISLVLRDGDAHLRNFGVLYNSKGRWFSPAYDICMTAMYYKENETDEHTSPFNETMALEMHGTREYPDAEGLLAFGMEACRLTRAETINGLSDIQRAVNELCNGGVEKSLRGYLYADKIGPMFHKIFNNFTMENIVPR